MLGRCRGVRRVVSVLYAARNGHSSLQGLRRRCGLVRDFLPWFLDLGVWFSWQVELRCCRVGQVVREGEQSRILWSIRSFEGMLLPAPVKIHVCTVLGRYRAAFRHLWGPEKVSRGEIRSWEWDEDLERSLQRSSPGCLNIDLHSRAENEEF